MRLIQGTLTEEPDLFLTPVVTLWGAPICLSLMEMSYYAFGFGTIIRRDLRPRRNVNSRQTKLLGGLSYEKIGGYSRVNNGQL